MQTRAKPIEVITYSGTDGELRPIKFRMCVEENKQIVVPILRIVSQQREKLAGNDMIRYRCLVKIDDLPKVIEIKYELDTCRWILFKT